MLGAAGCTGAALAWVVAAGRELERLVQGGCTSTAQDCTDLGDLGYCFFQKQFPGGLQGFHSKNIEEGWFFFIFSFINIYIYVLLYSCVLL